ncbi:MAG: hypothetical protein J6B06_01150 [Lachnospiraceae bacterium]|nr:hypothetical protein [Lachnospiraceae bacterium]
MRFPTFFALFVTFLVWLAYKLRKSDRQDNSFWIREAEADNVRRQTLDNLDYITIPLDSLPFFSGIDEKLDDIQQSIRNLAACTIVNLSKYTNTELKLMYGPANLTALTEYDQNFTNLVRTLQKWAECLSALGYDHEAIQVLEFAVSIKSDVTAGYVLLAKLYLKQNEPSRINSLISSASELDTLLKDSLVKQLEALRSQSQSFPEILP